MSVGPDYNDMIEKASCGHITLRTDSRIEHVNRTFLTWSIQNVTPADVYFGRAETILAERRQIKLATIANRRLQHRLQAA